jgi:hypothetical protein
MAPSRRGQCVGTTEHAHHESSSRAEASKEIPLLIFFGFIHLPGRRRPSKKPSRLHQFLTTIQIAAVLIFLATVFFIGLYKAFHSFL